MTTICTMTAADINAARTEQDRVNAIVRAELVRRGTQGIEGESRRVARELGYDLDAINLVAQGQVRDGDVVRYVGPALASPAPETGGDIFPDLLA